jgi:hypothetical protein
MKKLKRVHQARKADQSRFSYHCEENKAKVARKKALIEKSYTESPLAEQVSGKC